MEKDDEVKGNGNSYTTEFRQYDPRLGRWLSLDPVTHFQYSPYSAFDNNPIYWADPSGADSEGGPEGKNPDTKDETVESNGDGPIERIGGKVQGPEETSPSGGRVSNSGNKSPKVGTGEKRTFNLSFGNVLNIVRSIPYNNTSKPWIAQLYGQDKDFYNTKFKYPGDRIRPDEPNYQLMVNIPTSQNTFFTLLGMKQKFEPTASGFKLEAPTLVAGGMGQVYRRGKFTFTRTFTLGPILADAMVNNNSFNASVGKTIAGYGIRGGWRCFDWKSYC